MTSSNPELNQSLSESSAVSPNPMLTSGPQSDGSTTESIKSDFASAQTTHPMPEVDTPKNEAHPGGTNDIIVNHSESKDDFVISSVNETTNGSVNGSVNGLANGSVSGSVDSTQQNATFGDMNNTHFLGSASVPPIKLEIQNPFIPESKSRIGELSKETKQEQEQIQNAPESPKSRKRRLNTEKVRKYRQRKRAKMEAQLLAEGKPVTGKRQYKKRNIDTSAPIDKEKPSLPPNIQRPNENTNVTNTIKEEKLPLAPIILIKTENQMSSSAIEKRTFATADLCDAHVKSPNRLQAADAGILFDYGGIKSFHGKIETVRCFESNPLVRKTLGEPGNNRVLVVDGGGSKRVAILGDQLATMAKDNNWAGIIVHGCIRDSKIIASVPIGVKALGTHPLKSLKDYDGEKGGLVAFAGLEFRPGHWVYADEDGVIISENELTLPCKL